MPSQPHGEGQAPCLRNTTDCFPPHTKYRLSGVFKAIELDGEWIGHYPGHFDEVIRVTQRGDMVEAVKITGDDYVPAGATTWRANLTTL